MQLHIKARLCSIASSVHTAIHLASANTFISNRDGAHSDEHFCLLASGVPDVQRVILLHAGSAGAELSGVKC